MENELNLGELDSERSAYQKLLKDNARLEQRCENLQNELTRLRQPGSHHTRTPSNLSTISLQSDVTEPMRDDISEITTDGQDEVVVGPIDIFRNSILSYTSKLPCIYKCFRKICFLCMSDNGFCSMPGYWIWLSAIDQHYPIEI